MPEPIEAETAARREAAARCEVLAMYRRAREAGTVPLVAMADVRLMAADSVCETIVETGAVPQFWMTRFVVARDYTRRLTGRPWPLPP